VLQELLDDDKDGEDCSYDNVLVEDEERIVQPSSPEQRQAAQAALNVHIPKAVKTDEGLRVRRSLGAYNCALAVYVPVRLRQAVAKEYMVSASRKKLLSGKNAMLYSEHSD